MEKFESQAINAPEKELETMKRWFNNDQIDMIEDCLKDNGEPIKLNDQQKELIQAIANNKRVICKKPRATGGTTVVCAYVGTQMVLKNGVIVWVAVNEGLKKVVSERFKEFYKQFPDHLKDRDNQFVILNGNGSIENNLLNFGVDPEKVTMWIFDDAAVLKNGFEIYNKFCSKNSKVVLMSTPNYHDDFFYKIYDDAVNKKNDFAIVDFKWYKDPKYNKYLKWAKEDKVFDEPIKNYGGEIMPDYDRWNVLLEDGWKPSSPWYTNIEGCYATEEELSQSIWAEFFDNVVDLPDEASDDTPRQMDPEDAKKHTIERMSRDYDGAVVSAEIFFGCYPEAKEWFGSMVRYQNFDSILRFVWKNGSTYIVYFWTENNEYSIVFSVSDTSNYMGAGVSSRKNRPGETWNRGNDLPDGKCCYETFEKIKNGIISYELKTLNFKIEKDKSEKKIVCITEEDFLKLNDANIKTYRWDVNGWRRQAAFSTNYTWKKWISELEQQIDNRLTEIIGNSFDNGKREKFIFVVPINLLSFINDFTKYTPYFNPKILEIFDEGERNKFLKFFEQRGVGLLSNLTESNYSQIFVENKPSQFIHVYNQHNDLQMVIMFDGCKM
jgi:hypothetical protein